MGSVVQEIIYGYKPTKEKIREIKAWANSEIIIKKQSAIHEKLEKKEVEFNREQVEDAVMIIKFLPNRGLNVQKLFDRYGIRRDDQKEFIRRINWNLKIKIIRISDNKKIDFEEINYEKAEKFLVKPI